MRLALAIGAALGVAFGATVHVAAHAADVYMAIAPDGTPHYTTHPAGPSYQLVFREAAAEAGTSGSQANSRPSGRRKSEKAAGHLDATIATLAARHGVAPALVHAVAAVESAYSPAAVSPKGARGVMQMMPGTARQYGVPDAQALHDPERNIDAGVRHLKDLLARHQGNLPLALAAYNAGAQAVQRHGQRIPPYRETMLYVPAVLARAASSSPTTAP